MKEIQNPPHNGKGYRIKTGLLYYNENIFVPNLFGFREALFKEYHNTPSAGHSGVKAAVARISNSFAWPGLHVEVKAYVKHCTICQQNKYITQKKGVIATATYSSSGVGGSDYGFYHTSTKLLWPHRNLC